MLKLFQAGLEYTENVDEDDFFYRDFNFYCTKIVSRFPIMRHPQLVIVMWLFIYFFGSAVLFCGIMRNENVCPTTTDFAFGGWMTSIYFAGTTMSTVGYGDVSLYDEDEPGITFIGTCFMLVSIGFGYSVFSTAAEITFGGLFGFDMYSYIDGKIDTNPDKPLHQQIRRLVWLRVGELAFYFLVLNFAGAFIARAFVNRSPVPEEQWNWSTTIYWAVQTTTTIGYGDLDQPFLLRWVSLRTVRFYTRNDCNPREWFG
jgi:Ion channel